MLAWSVLMDVAGRPVSAASWLSSVAGARLQVHQLELELGGG